MFFCMTAPKPLSPCKSTIEYSKPNDIILIAGKGHENYQIIGTEKHHFDDKEIVTESCTN